MYDVIHCASDSSAEAPVPPCFLLASMVKTSDVILIIVRKFNGDRTTY